MNTKLIGISIAAVVGIIVLGSVLMPILDDATATTDTYTNEGLFYLKKIDTSADTVTISWDYTDPAVLTVNGNAVDLPLSGSILYSPIDGDDWAIRCGHTESDTTFNGLYTTGAVTFALSTSDEKNMNIVLDSGTATVTIGTDEYEYTYTECYHIDTDGSYVMKKSTDYVYLNGDSEIYCIGRSTWTGGNVNIRVDGNIDDGINITPINREGYTVSDEVYDYTEVNEHEDLYSFKGLSFVVTDTASPPKTHAITYSQVIVPAEVTAERSVHFTDGQNAILGAIPIMIIVAILLGVIALVVRSRME